MTRARCVALFALSFIAIFLASCGQAGGPAKTGTRGGMLTYRMSSPPTTFNYLMAADEPTVIASFFLMQGRLVDLDHKTQQFVPGLAESWKTAADGQTVDVKLRDGLKFSDGSELTSDDVVFTLNAIYDERTKSPAWRDSMLVGGKPITAKAIDKLNVQLVFPQQVAGVENYLSNIGVLSSKALKSAFDAGKLGEAWKIDADPKTIVCSGPFVVESSTAGERVNLARNPNYWKKDAAGDQLPMLDKLVIEVVPDPNNAIAKLQQNQLDVVDRIRPADYATLNSTPGAIKPVDVGPGPGTDHLWFNLTERSVSPKRDWFADKRFRQAVSAAIDRETIAKTTLRGLATPIYGFVSPGNKSWVDNDLAKTEYSLDKAAQLLSEAGFQQKGTPEAPELTDAKGNAVAFTIVVPQENEPRKLMAATVQEDLAKLGIKVEIAPIEFRAVTERWTKTFDYDAILLGLSVTDVEPSSFANFLMSTGDAHQWQPNEKTPATDWEKQIDELFAQQAAETDVAKRKTTFNEIQKIMADQLPVIPIVARHVVSAANSRVAGLDPSPIVPYSLWNADQLSVTQ